MTKQCYWCGAPATSDDHVPAQCFYPTDKRNNLIKVPSCQEHNGDLSKLDERFRYYIQSTSQSDLAAEAFKGAALRSIQRPEAKGFRAHLFQSMTPVFVGW